MYELLLENVSAYGICTAAGFVAAAAVVVLLAWRRKALSFEFLALSIIAIIGTFLGAHIMYFIVGLPEFIEYCRGGSVINFDTFIDAVFSYSSGLVFYGGLLGALASLAIACRSSRFTVNMRSELNNFCVAFPLFHALGRIGCAINGCCYGIEYHGLFAIHYTEDHIRGSVNADIADFPRFPVQPLEAAIELIIFAVLLFIYLKYKDRYSITCIYLLLYSIVRFFDEFLRGDTVRGSWGPFSTSQWISLIIFCSVTVYLLIRRRKNLQTV